MMKIVFNLRACMTVASLCLATNASAAVDCTVLGRLADQAYQSTADANKAHNYSVAYAYSRSFWNIADAAGSQCSLLTANANNLNQMALYARDASPPTNHLLSMLRAHESDNNTVTNLADLYCSQSGTCKITIPSHTSNTGLIANPH